MSSVFLGLGQEGQEHISKFGSYMIGPEQLEGVREIYHFGDRRGVLQRVVSEREGNSCHLSMKSRSCIQSMTGDDFCFTLRRRVFHPNIETAPSNRVAQMPLFIAGDHDKRNACCFNRA